MEQSLTVNDVAKLFRVDDYTVRRWIKLGILEADTIIQGKRHRYLIKKSVVAQIRKDQTPVDYFMLM